MMAEGRKFDVCIECVHGLTKSSQKWWPRHSGSSWTRRAVSGTRGSNGFHAGLLRMRPGNQALHLFYMPTPGEHICIPFTVGGR